MEGVTQGAHALATPGMEASPGPSQHPHLEQLVLEGRVEAVKGKVAQHEQHAQRGRILQLNLGLHGRQV